MGGEFVLTESVDEEAFIATIQRLSILTQHRDYDAEVHPTSLLSINLDSDINFKLFKRLVKEV